jgi:hypothetical protein
MAVHYTRIAGNRLTVRGTVEYADGTVETVSRTAVIPEGHTPTMSDCEDVLAGYHIEPAVDVASLIPAPAPATEDVAEMSVAQVRTWARDAEQDALVAALRAEEASAFPRKGAIDALAARIDPSTPGTVSR